MPRKTEDGQRPGSDHAVGSIRAAADQGILNRLAVQLEALASSRNFWLLALGSAFAIGPAMLPMKWSGNEIVYFDLAYRSVEPDAFTDAHAMFDASNSRVAAMMTIGFFIKAFGFETAKTILALLAWALYALGLAAVARSIGMRVAEVVAALVVFILARQSLVGGEWIFDTTEPKVLAYIFVFFGLSAALRQRWLPMTALVVVATYFHFLVGGAWALLFLLLLAMNGARWQPLAGLLALYTLLVSPIVLVLVHEQIGASVDLSSLDRPVDQIYAVFRAPHHVAPFAKGLSGFGVHWLPGLTMHAALAFTLLYVSAGAGIRDRALLHWAAILNVLLPVAALAAFVDSQTHHLAKFLIFRPSALVLLISCLLVVRWIAGQATRDNNRFIGAILVIVAALQLPAYLEYAARTLVGPAFDTRLERQMTPDQRDVREWIRLNTPKDAAVLVESPSANSLSEGEAFPLGLERLTGRGFIVFFKNVPSDTADFVRWYGLLAAKAAFFAGDCGQLTTLKADFVVFQSNESLLKLKNCADPTYSNDSFIVARTRATP